ncbi:hypothetical protein AYL99_06326 [Fonsecaea erecta]|uniref:Uncharacterized protein n=1 Tax=Fonsecaea erecta TaxID=1367422 RepID=A0A178ZGV3_9EURO|nr:hypothetical protein AYL99_06326 [Fonsecaea erecta]OAP59029.1 hypothetical protein AYL99_06326 [Fonsecaea erecta]
MRSLKPKSSEDRAGASSQIFSDDEAHVEKPSPSTPSTTAVKPRKNVSRACDQCRKRRRKVGRPCTYDMGSKNGGDGRRNRNTARHVEKLHEQQVVLNQLFGLIRNSDADEAIRAVKEGATFEEIAELLRKTSSKDPWTPLALFSSSKASTGESSSPTQMKPDQSDRPEADLWRSTRSAKESPEAAQHAGETPGRTTLDKAPESSKRARSPSVVVEPGDDTSGDRVWTGLARRLSAADLSKINMPIFSCDPYHVESDDILSKTILSFRDGARKALQGQAKVLDVIGPKTPDLDLFLRERREGDPHTAWTWACELAKAYPLPLTVQLVGVFVAGIQMRYFIHPCKETYDDLPVMLRPTRQQYAQPHAAGADICAIPPIKTYLLSHWDSYASLLQAGQYHNWPYSNQACLGWDRTRKKYTLSTAFLEHISNPKNHSVGPQILELVPEAAAYVVRDEGSTRPEDIP